MDPESQPKRGADRVSVVTTLIIKDGEGFEGENLMEHGENEENSGGVAALIVKDGEDIDGMWLTVVWAEYFT